MNLFDRILQASFFVIVISMVGAALTLALHAKHALGF